MRWSNITQRPSEPSKMLHINMEKTNYNATEYREENIDASNSDRAPQARLREIDRFKEAETRNKPKKGNST